MNDDLMRIANSKRVVQWTRVLAAAREYHQAREAVMAPITQRGKNAMREAERERDRAIAAEFDAIAGERGVYTNVPGKGPRLVDPGDTIPESLSAAWDALEAK